MSWFAELVIAAAFERPAPEGRHAAIVSQSPLDLPFCHNLAEPPLRFGPGAMPMLRRHGGAVWMERQLPLSSADEAGRPALADRRVLADLRGFAPAGHRGMIALIAELSGAPPMLVRQGREGPAPAGYRVLWETAGRDDLLWISAAAGPAGEFLAGFVRRHRAGEADAYDTALAHMARPGLVTGLRFSADGGAVLSLDPMWCLRGLDRLRGARAMLAEAIAIEPGDPLSLTLPSLLPADETVEIGILGASAAVRTCRLRLEGSPVPARPDWHRGAGRFRLAIGPAAAAARQIEIEGQGVSLGSVALCLPPPLPGLYGSEFPDPLDRYEMPDGAAG